MNERLDYQQQESEEQQQALIQEALDRVGAGLSTIEDKLLLERELNLTRKGNEHA
jgi:hypothetical protein